MFARLSNRTLGYVIAAIVMAPLMFWARQSEAGMWTAAGVILVALLAMLPYRLRHRVWPGDEHRLMMSAEEKRAVDRRGWAAIAALIVLCVALALYVQSRVT